jgi:hypothetical protein
MIRMHHKISLGLSIPSVSPATRSASLPQLDRALLVLMAFALRPPRDLDRAEIRYAGLFVHVGSRIGVAPSMFQTVQDLRRGSPGYRTLLLHVKCSYTPVQYEPKLKPKRSSSSGIPKISPPLNAGRFHTCSM